MDKNIGVEKNVYLKWGSGGSGLLEIRRDEYIFDPKAL